MIENWHSHFVPECYFDTVLFKKILKTSRRLKHRKGCNNVVRSFMSVNGKKGDLYEMFGVGMVDKDKQELNYLKECITIIELENLVLWKHKEEKKLHFVIQLKPPIEKWVVEILKYDNKTVENFDYPSDFKKLKKALKHDLDSENDYKLDKLITAIVESNNPTIKKLKAILVYLKNKTYEADINELKNV
jgi:hypothetical protein